MPMTGFPYSPQRLSLLHVRLSSAPPTTSEDSMSSRAAMSVAGDMASLALWLLDHKYTGSLQQILRSVKAHWPAYLRWITALFKIAENAPYIPHRTAREALVLKPELKDRVETIDVAVSFTLFLHSLAVVSGPTAGIPIRTWFTDDLVKLLVKTWILTEPSESSFSALAARMVSFVIVQIEREAWNAGVDMFYRALRDTLQAHKTDRSRFLITAVRRELPEKKTSPLVLVHLYNGMHVLLSTLTRPFETETTLSLLHDTIGHGGLELATAIFRRITSQSQVFDQGTVSRPISVTELRMDCLGTAAYYLSLCFAESPYWVIRALDQGLLPSIAKSLMLLDENTIGSNTDNLLGSLINSVEKAAIYHGVSVRLSSSLRKIQSLRLESPVASLARGSSRLLEAWESLKARVAVEEQARAICDLRIRTLPRALCSNTKCMNENASSVDSVCLFRRCSRCFVPCYCSRACQKADWKQGHAVICQVDSVKHLVGLPPPILQSNLERSYFMARIALDAQTFYKDEITSMLELKRKPDSLDSNSKVYIRMDYTRHHKPRISILDEESLPFDWQVVNSDEIRLVGFTAGDGGKVPDICFQRVPFLS